jgi:hypothetical protein
VESVSPILSVPPITSFERPAIAYCALLGVVAPSAEVARMRQTREWRINPGEASHFKIWERVNNKLIISLLLEFTFLAG